MTAATLVVTAQPNPDEPEAMQEYLQGVMPLFVAAGGKLVKRLRVNHVVEGPHTGMAMVMDFDSAAAISDLFASSEYADLLPARNRGFKDLAILVTEDL